MGQINLVQEAIPFTKKRILHLVSGILNDDPIFAGSRLQPSRARWSFCSAAQLSFLRDWRINVVSPQMLKESESQFAQFFTGMIPVEGWRVDKPTNAHPGAQTGRVYRLIELTQSGWA